MSLQQQSQKKESLLSELILSIIQYHNQLQPSEVPLSNMSSSKPPINLMQFFDLIIWIQKRKPILLESVIEMDVIGLIVRNIQISNMEKQIRAFILLINNTKVDGVVMEYLLVNRLVDIVVYKYLRAIHSQYDKGTDNDQKMEYLGSILKAYHHHLTEKTYPYYLSPKNMFNINNNAFDEQISKSINLQSNKYIKKEDKKYIKNKQKQINNKQIQMNNKQTQMINKQAQMNHKKQYIDNIQNNQINQQYKKLQDIFNNCDELMLKPNKQFPLKYKSQQQLKYKDQQQLYCKNQQQLNQKSQYSLKQQEKQQKQCFLLKICCRFYNCPQQLTKTSVLNILMSMLKSPFSSSLISLTIHASPILCWSFNLCQQFRNQLKNFNQCLSIISQMERQALIEEINDRIILWEDLTNLRDKAIFKTHFWQLVVVPLLVGSLNTNSMPMFNVKFTFFLIAKLAKVIHNLGLTQQLARILFLKTTLNYHQSWVSTAVLKGFELDSLLDDEYYQVLVHDHQQVNEFCGTNDFFLNMLKSKDEHFLLISTNLLIQLLSLIKKQPLIKMNQPLCLLKNSPTSTILTSILLSQLKYDHSLNTLKRICQTLIYVQFQKCFGDDNMNQFVYLYAQILTQTVDNVDKGNKYNNYLAETFQYDMKILQLLKFVPKIIKDTDLLVHPTINSNQPLKDQQNKKKFYDMIPQTPTQMLRYRVIKAFLLLKLKQIVLQNQSQEAISSTSISQHKKSISQSSIQNQLIFQKPCVTSVIPICNIFTKYVSKLTQWQKKQLKPGDLLPYPLKQKFYQCRLIEQKTEVPCVLIQDDVCFILGFVQAKHVKVIINAKIKHITWEVIPKKDKVYVQIHMNKFDYNIQNIMKKGSFLIKHFDQGGQYFAVKKDNFREKQISSIKKGLRKTLQTLPQISLL